MPASQATKRCVQWIMLLIGSSKLEYDRRGSCLAWVQSDAGGAYKTPAVLAEKGKLEPVHAQVD